MALLPALSGAQGQMQPLVFGINEGVTYRISPSEVRERYREIADDLTKVLKRPVRIESMDEYVQMGKDLEAGRYDLAYVHPAHYAIRAIDKARYRLVAVTKGYTEYRASFLIRNDATFQSLTDPRIHQIGMPDADSITAWIVRATLRDALGPSAKKLRLRYTRYQDAVPFMVDYGFAEVGATAASAVIKEYTAKGGKVDAEQTGADQGADREHEPVGAGLRTFSNISEPRTTDQGQRRLAKARLKGLRPTTRMR
jgi:ABC-type phosphate/phosphonate transport system substrate-binding protein